MTRTIHVLSLHCGERWEWSTYSDDRRPAIEIEAHTWGLEVTMHESNLRNAVVDCFPWSSIERYSKRREVVRRARR